MCMCTTMCSCMCTVIKMPAEQQSIPGPSGLNESVLLPAPDTTRTEFSMMGIYYQEVEQLRMEVGLLHAEVLP